LQLGDKLIKKLLTEGLAPISYIHSLGRFFVKWSNSLQRADTAYFLVNDDFKRTSASLELIALDPRCATVNVLDACHSSVHLSGTLQPISAHIDLVGLPKGTQVLNLPSPFSSNQIFPVISLGVTTAMKYRTPRMFNKITRRIIEVCQASTHNVGIFVPSYSVLQSLLNSGLASLINRELFVEKPGRSSNENDAMIQAFKDRADTGAALLGVLSGRNSEGEDYPGNEMQTVVVVGIPYPRPNPIESTRIDYFNQQFPGKGRLYGYQLPALRSASQAAGRSVRRLEDRGAIVFLDDRYATPYCSRLLPNWIIENLKSSDDSDGILFDKLKAFYSEV
jgi:DNA excision repair protein ERCC-2